MSDIHTIDAARLLNCLVCSHLGRKAEKFTVIGGGSTGNRAELEAIDSLIDVFEEAKKTDPKITRFFRREADRNKPCVLWLAEQLKRGDHARQQATHTLWCGLVKGKKKKMSPTLYSSGAGW